MEIIKTTGNDINPAHAWFDEARFGMFVHWGLYSILGRGEWVMYQEKIPPDEYAGLADTFKPDKLGVSSWVDLAKRAGAKYMVLTTRHHDGFSLYDSKVNPFNSVRTAAKRDFVAEYVKACREAGLKVGLYYSLMSWRHPAIFAGPLDDPSGWAAMVEETFSQVRELMSNYGKIDLLWYDGGFVPRFHDCANIARHWRARELNKMVRELQPGILINNRSGTTEDFRTPEQHISPLPSGCRWEACVTINRSWGYRKDDCDFKSPGDIIQSLIRCSRYGGNLLLNIGPMADGTVQPECVERLETIGNWLRHNGEAIYNSVRCRYSETEHLAGPVTCKPGRLYVFLSRHSSLIRLDGLLNPVKAWELGNGAEIKIKKVADNVYDFSGFSAFETIDLPEAMRVELESVSADSANFLGADLVPEIEAGDAPILEINSDRYEPDSTPLFINGRLAHFLKKDEHISEDGESWCPGFERWVYRPVAGNQIELELPVQVDSKYDIELGLIGCNRGTFSIASSSNDLNEEKIFRSPGCPDTFVLRNFSLHGGQQKLFIKSNISFGLYAVRLTPCQRILPTKDWLCIGPFPSRFGPQRPVEFVREAMKVTFPPEEEFRPNIAYTGAGEREVRWRHVATGQGDQAERRVNFSYICGVEDGGVCYARTVIFCPEERDAEILFGCDWWANVLVNGEIVQSLRDGKLRAEDGCWFSGWKPNAVHVRLIRGENIILIKNHGGTGANWFTFAISDPGDLTINPEMKA